MDIAELGAQYREAKASIGTHRRAQAVAEVRLGVLLRGNRGRPDTEDITAARHDVDKAVADVEWCRAVTIAAGEMFKGASFDDLPHDTAAQSALLRARILAPLEAEA